MFKEVKESLYLKDEFVIAISPERLNLTFSVQPKLTIPELGNEIAKQLKEERKQYPKTIVFCRRYEECARLYQVLQQVLQQDFVEPPGSQDLHVFRLVDMYTRASLPEMNEKVLASFKNKDSKLRIDIATLAFGMGVDCPDIRQIIQFGPASLVEDYVQETGRAGRNGFPSKAVLINKPSKHVGKEMKAYCENTTHCRRQLLLKNFICYVEQNIVPLCSCCDICAAMCECEKCYNVQ